MSNTRTVAALYIDPRGPYPTMNACGCYDRKAPGHVCVFSSQVDCWDEERDARLYAGPYPVVAHPPCGPWSKLRHLCSVATLATADCGIRAVAQVRVWGGVLEHPEYSRLWSETFPEPGYFYCAVCENVFRAAKRCTRCGRSDGVNHGELPGPMTAFGASKPWLRIPAGISRGTREPSPDAFGGYTIAVNQVEWGHCCSKPTWLYLVGVPRSALTPPPFPGREPTHCICTGPRQIKRLPVASKPLKRRTPPLFAEWLVSLARASRAPGTA